MGQNTYLLKDDVTFTQLLQNLQNTYTLKADKKVQTQSSYFDTFDWRLFRNGWGIRFSDDQLNLVDLENENILASVVWKKRVNPRFYWDLTESKLRDLISPSLTVRALIPLVKMDRQRQTYRMLNKDEKTVLFIHFYTFQVTQISELGSQILLVDIQPLRGYKSDAHNIQALLPSLGLEHTAVNESILVMKSVGLMPGAYSSKFKVSLKPDMTAETALRKIFLNLLETIQNNRDGVVQDLDTEFLHDYRVAIRRTRAGLNQIPAVLPDEWVNYAKREFSSLGGLSNHLRDLDVYLLEEDNYRSLLPEPLRKGLHPLFKRLAIERGREQRKVAQSLKNPDLDNMLSQWNNWLNTPAEQGDLANADRPILELANELILIRFQMIIRSGNKIKSTSPDEKLHRLRLQCKKLRYLMEFFASLYPQAEILYLIKQLKQLQDNLGKFNDLFVQQNQLGASLQKINQKTQNMVEEAAAIGGLLAVLNLKQQQVRIEFKRKYKLFSSPGNQSKFQQLFDKK